MKLLRLAVLSLAVVLAGGCANKPLQHTYQGDVHLRFIDINIDAIALPEKEASGTLAKIAQVQRVFQRLDKMLDDKQSELLDQQLREFAEILAKGIRDASGIPLIVSEDVLIQMGYDDTGQLVRILFEYPRNEGPYMHVFGNIFHGDGSSSGFGWSALNQGTVTVRPTLQLQLTGYAGSREMFWNNSHRYESNQRYQFGNQFVLGVSTKKFEGSEIFLIPMAKGISNELMKKKSAGKL